MPFTRAPFDVTLHRNLNSLKVQFAKLSKGSLTNTVASCLGKWEILQSVREAPRLLPQGFYIGLQEVPELHSASHRALWAFMKAACDPQLLWSLGEKPV